MSGDAQQPKRAMSKNEIDELFSSDANDVQDQLKAEFGSDEGEDADGDDLEGSLAPDMGGAEEDAPAAQPVEFGQLTPQEGMGDQANIHILLDVKLPISVELGRNRLPVKEILGFSPGSIVELNRVASEPVDLMVNGVLIARGEVVVIDDHFGVRLTSLISPEERIRSLGAGEA